ncbi:MAG: hypothetical protein Q7R73_02820 [bacterium]|nr:hypothetical protein [bacterium]
MSRFSLMILSAVIGLLLIGFVAVPGVRNIFALLKTQTDLEGNIAELHDIMTSRDRLQAEYRAIPEADITKLNQILPEGPEIGNLLSVYEALAKRNGLALISIDFSGGAQVRAGGAQAARPTSASNQKIVKAPSGDATLLPVVQNLQGSYDAFRRYLRDIEFLLNVTDITDISFSPSDLQNASFSIRGATYYFQK